MTDCGERGGRKLFCSILLHDVLHHRDHGGASFRLDLLRKLLEPGSRELGRQSTNDADAYRAYLGIRGKSNEDSLVREVRRRVDH